MTREDAVNLVDELIRVARQHEFVSASSPSDARYSRNDLGAERAKVIAALTSGERSDG
jgi:hypothetical protein